MKKYIKWIFLLSGCFVCITIQAQQKKISLKILQTSDIHGNYFPYDFIEEKPAQGSLSRISTYVKQEKKKYGNHLILLDNGDILQGQPSAYYYNFIDTSTIHLCARMLNYMGYSAGSMGNHDIETGNNVYDRFISQTNFPWLAANALLDNNDEDTYFKPYAIYEIENIRIAVIGMITPAIPTWLPKKLWQNMHFENIQTTANKWIPILHEKEKADVIIGLFHLGMDSRIVAGGIDEGGGYDIAHNIPGLDVVMLGHDHRTACKKITNINGDSVIIINPGAHGNYLSDVEINLIVEDGKVIKKQTSGQLVNMKNYDPDPEFLKLFDPDYQIVKEFVSKKIGTFTTNISSRDAYFGPSGFVDLIHQIQLDLTNADVSFAAPLSYDTKIKKGDIFVSDMFKLYKYENFLYTMTLSGKEIKGFLENCYSIWMNQMHNSEDHLLLIKEEKNNSYRFVNASYNFDSASGISYIVDVSKPAGKRITISTKMKNGKEFDMNQVYKVAVNSYRGNGGGGHLTEGSGIPLENLPSRIIDATPVDLRYYMMQWIEQKQIINPQIISDWKIIPEEWYKIAAKRDYELLFKTD